MFAYAAAGAISAVSTIVSTGTAVVFTIAAIAAAVVFSVNIAVKKCLAFSAGKDFFRFFVKPKAGGSVAALFINTMVTNKVPVGNFLSAIAFDRNAVRNKIMSFSAVFTSAFMFHWQKPFQ